VVAHKDREQEHACRQWLVSWNSATGLARAKRLNETAERVSRGERSNQWPRT
jgi:hypothetical protein